MKIRFTATALTEIDEIFAYITERNPTAARTVVERVIKVVAGLAAVPEMGQVTDEKRIRRMPAAPYPYLIFYTVDADEVVILHVRHGARRDPWMVDE